MDQYQFHVSVFTLIASSRVGGEIEMERWGWLGEKSKHREKSMLGKKACSVKKECSEKRHAKYSFPENYSFSNTFPFIYSWRFLLFALLCAASLCVLVFSECFSVFFSFSGLFRVFFGSFFGSSRSSLLFPVLPFPFFSSRSLLVHSCSFLTFPLLSPSPYIWKWVWTRNSGRAEKRCWAGKNSVFFEFARTNCVPVCAWKMWLGTWTRELFCFKDEYFKDKCSKRMFFEDKKLVFSFWARVEQFYWRGNRILDFLTEFCGQTEFIWSESYWVGGWQKAFTWKKNCVWNEKFEIGGFEAKPRKPIFPETWSTSICDVFR